MTGDGQLDLPAQEAAQARRRNLLKAAGELVSRGGFKAATIRAIAESAGVASGSVYRSFESGPRLLAEVYRDFVRSEFAVVEDAALHEELSLKERLTAVLKAFSVRALSNPVAAGALLFEPVHPLVEEERQIFKQRYNALVVTMITDAINAGEIPDQNIALSARCIVGANAEALIGHLSPDEPVEEPDRIADEITAFAVRGLGLTNPS